MKTARCHWPCDTDNQIFWEWANLPTVPTILGDDRRMSSPQEEEVFVLASTYLDDAIHCRNINFVPEREETRSYRLYKSRPLTALVYVAVVVICLLALFERPALNRCVIKLIIFK